MKYQDHPLAELFPLMEKDDLFKLSEDISAHGLRAPITLLDGKIIDGRNRYRACNLAQVEPKFREHKGGNVLEFVISANLHRRHLDASQRAMVAAEISNFTHGGDRKSKDQEANLPVEEAAEKLNVSPRAVRAAKKVKRDNPSAVKKIKAGTMSVNAALEEAKDKEQAKEDEKKIHLDREDHEIPAALWELWQRAEIESSRLAKMSHDIALTVRRGVKEKDDVFRAFGAADTADYDRTHYMIANNLRPHTVCPSCHGAGTDTLCYRRGYISKFQFMTVVSKEVRDMWKKK